MNRITQKTTPTITTATTIPTPITKYSLRLINVLLNKPGTSINISVNTGLPRGATTYTYISNGVIMSLQVITADFIENLQTLGTSLLQIPGIEFEKSRTYYVVSAFAVKNESELLDCLVNELSKLVSLKVLLLEPNDLKNIVDLLDTLKHGEWIVTTIHWDEENGSWTVSESEKLYVETIPPKILAYSEVYPNNVIGDEITTTTTNPKPITRTISSSTFTATPSTIMKLESEKAISLKDIEILMGIAVITAIVMVILFKKVLI